MASTLEEAKKFLEGWTSYKSEQAKGSKKCWMVLRGTSIFLFSSDKPNKEMLGSLSLGPGTCMTDIKSKREFKFELAATNREGQFQKGVFKFNKESDYHLWKAYIVAISTGSIPTDVRLLPAQQSDVYEAMVEVRKKSNSGAGNTAASSGRRQTHPLPSPSSSQNPLSPGRHLDDAEDAEDDDDPAIRQLTKRLEELAEREINDREVTASVTSWPINEIMETVRPKGGPSSSSFSVSSSRAVATADATVGSAPPPPTTTNSANQNSTTTQSKRTSFLFANHVFYSGGVRNSNATPSWFVNCSREQAEEILASERFGTVLMRASSGFPFNGNYVISFRREFQGKVVVSHYNILRTEDGFKLDVENQHAPMHSLSVVMDFFSSAAGKSAKPLTSNDLTELLGKYQAEAFPAVVGKETVQRRSVGSSSVHSFDRDSFHSQPPTTTTLSSRSSFADGQSSSSFDLSGGGGGGSRRTSDAHAHRLPFNADDRRNSSASSSSVFYHHHQNQVTELVGGSSSSSSPPPPPSSYGGSFTGSVNGSGSVTTKDPYYSGNRSLSVEEDAAPANDDDQIYSNQSETIAVPPDSGASGGGGEEQRHRASVGHRGSDGTLRSSVGLDRRGFDATQISRTSWEQQQQQQQPQQLNASYGGTAASRRQQQQQQSPPAPPPKPGPHEIYQLMKPLPPSAAEGEYSSSGASSEIYRASSNGVNLEAPTSVKELARMLQCSLEK